MSSGTIKKQKDSQKQGLVGVKSPETQNKPSVIIDSHMHIMSSRCSLMPGFLGKVFHTAGQMWPCYVSRTTVENLDKILKHVNLNSGLAGAPDTIYFEQSPAMKVTAADWFRETGFYKAATLGEKNTFEVGKEFIKEQTAVLNYLQGLPEYKGRHIVFPAILQTMDMEYAHIDGYFGIKIYNGIYDIKDKEKNTPLAYWYPYHSGPFAKSRHAVDVSNRENAESVGDLDQLGYGRSMDDINKIFKKSNKANNGIIVNNYNDTEKVRLNFTPKLLHNDEVKKYENWDKQLKYTELTILANPLKLIPMYHYDPRRWNHNVRNAVSATDAPMAQVTGSGLYLGFKMYTAQGYRPADYQRLRDLPYFYSKCEQLKIPIMNHCTKGGMNTYDKPEYYYFNHPNDNQEDYALKKKYSIVSKTEYFDDNFIAPDAWKPVLERCPELYLCLAHFGGSEKGDEKWSEQIIRLMIRYENVYSDISSSFSKDSFRAYFKKAYNANKSILKHRIIFGTDWYMTYLSLSPDVDYMKYCKTTKEFLDGIDPTLWTYFTLVNPIRFYNLNDESRIDRILNNIIKKRKTKEYRDILAPLTKKDIKELKQAAALIKQVSAIETALTESVANKKMVDALQKKETSDMIRKLMQSR